MFSNVLECYGVDDCAYDGTNRAHASECAAGVEAYGRRHDRRARARACVIDHSGVEVIRDTLSLVSRYDGMVICFMRCTDYDAYSTSTSI